MHRAYLHAHLADSTLTRELAAAVGQESSSTAVVIGYIAEFDARRLYLPAGYSSMFAYCVGKLGLSEDATAKRIQAARAARRFPVLFELLAAGELHLTGIGMLAPHLTESNARELIAAARRKTKAQIDELLASRFPRPELPELVQPIVAGTSHQNSQHAPAHVASANALPDANLNFASAPIPTSASTAGRPRLDDAPIACAVAHADRPKTTPVSADRFGVQLTMDRSMQDKLRHAQELLGHQLRSGDLAGLLEEAECVFGAGFMQQKRERARGVPPTLAAAPSLASAQTGGEAANMRAPTRA